jgi:hypothetical protein
LHHYLISRTSAVMSKPLKTQKDNLQLKLDVSTQNTSSSISTPTITPEIKEEELKIWVDKLYDKSLMSFDELKNFWEVVSYKGFDRQLVLKDLFYFVKDQKIAIQLILVTAIRGPQAASKIKLPNGRSPVEMGIPASGGKGQRGLTLNKILSATADIAAFYLKEMNVPKRVISDLPAWLQFPSAGSIRMPRNIRELHRDFSKRFSELIGGVFQQQIYDQMELNSYLDDSLKLFT